MVVGIVESNELLPPPPPPPLDVIATPFTISESVVMPFVTVRPLGKTLVAW
jgi:hypothetical protein